MGKSVNPGIGKKPRKEGQERMNRHAQAATVAVRGSSVQSAGEGIEAQSCQLLAVDLGNFSTTSLSLGFLLSKVYASRALFQSFSRRPARDRRSINVSPSSLLLQLLQQ